MLFSLKIFICIVVAIALSFATGSYLLISSNFTAAKDREISLARDEYLSLQYIFASALLTQELQGQKTSDGVVRTAAQVIASNLLQNGQGRRDIFIYDSQGLEIYPVTGQKAPYIQALTSSHTRQVVYAIERAGQAYTLLVTGVFTYNSRKMYLSYSENITEVFAQRDAQEHAFMLYQGVNILVSAALAFFISWLLTRPVRKLTQTSRRIAAGDYGWRADIRSSDEIGELAQSFNRMAASVEEKISALEQSAHTKDDFIANFTHEIKTPMTSIIGYADMLRSKQLDPATVFKAANYIYSEANRLEALSLKMLKLVMLDQQGFTFIPINGAALLKYVVRAAMPSFQQAGMTIKASAQEGYILVEPDLMKTLLLNIVENARKASNTGSTVELLGTCNDEQYIFTVTDHGRGIPSEELGKITEAFYMVDKSRSKAQNGVGLGLSIASRIATLHTTTLQFRSRVANGTSVSINLPSFHIQENENEE